MIPICDYRTSFTHHILIYKIFGFWTPPKMKFKKMYTLYRYVCLVTWVLFLISQIVYMILNRTDIDEITATLFVTLTFSLILIKMLVLYRNMDRIQLIITNLQRPLFQIKSQKQCYIVERAQKLALHYFYLCLFFGSATDVFWSLAPFLGDQRTTYEKGWYPFDWRVSPHYEIFYAFQGFTCIMNTFLCLNQDSFYATLTTQVCLQCELLCDTLKNLDSYQAENGFLTEISEEEKIILTKSAASFSTSMTENLVVCVNRHRHILQ